MLLHLFIVKPVEYLEGSRTLKSAKVVDGNTGTLIFISICYFCTSKLSLRIGIHIYI